MMSLKAWRRRGSVSRRNMLDLQAKLILDLVTPYTYAGISPPSTKISFG